MVPQQYKLSMNNSLEDHLLLFLYLLFLSSHGEEISRGAVKQKGEESRGQNLKIITTWRWAQPSNNQYGQKTSGHEVSTSDPFLIGVEFCVFAVCIESLALSLTLVNLGMTPCFSLSIFYQKNLGVPYGIHLKWAG